MLYIANTKHNITKVRFIDTGGKKQSVQNVNQGWFIFWLYALYGTAQCRFVWANNQINTTYKQTNDGKQELKDKHWSHLKKVELIT